MFRPIFKWVVKVEKSYIELCFKFDTAEGAHDFYEVLRSAYVKNIDDRHDVSVEIFAEYEKEYDEKEEGESE